MNIPLLNVLLSACCRTLFPVGLRVLASSSLLLGIWHCAAWAMRRSDPPRRLLLHQSALSGVGMCLLLAIFAGGGGQSLWNVSLPVFRQMEDNSSDRQSSVTVQAASRPAAPPIPSPTQSPGLRLTEAKQPFVQVQGTGASSASTSTSADTLKPFTGFLNSAPLPLLLTPYGKLTLMGVALWASVVVLLLSRLMIGYTTIYCLRRRAVQVRDRNVIARLKAVCVAQGVRAPALLVSEEVGSVFLAGLFKPAILLPTNSREALEGETLNAVFAHEVAHLRAKEGWWTLTGNLLCAICWMQPLLWKLCREREQAAEEVCDQAALEQGCSPQGYAACLLRLAERLLPTRFEQVAGGGSMVFRSSLSRRIQTILRAAPCQSSRLPKTWRAAAGIASLLLAGFLSRMVSAQTTQADTSLLDNPRLNQRVIVSAEGIPVGDLLLLLSQKTGVPIKADGFTADDKVIVFGPARPLRDVMADLAALFNDTWLHSRNGDRHSYRLTRNPRERDYETNLAEEMNRRLLAQMQAQVQALEETPLQLAKRPAEDPIRKALSTHSGRAATSIFALLTPVQRRQLLETWQQKLPVSALTEAQKDSVEPLFHGELFHQEPAPGAPDAGVPITEIPRADMDKHEVTFTVLKASAVKRQSSVMSIYLSAPTGQNMQVGDFPTEARFVLPSRGNPYTGKGVKVEKPALDAQAIFEVREGAWPDKLRALAEKTGKPVMADYYRSRPVIVAAEEEARTGGPPAAQAMDGFCKPEGYLWWNRNETLLLRKRDWYNQQLYEIPDRWTLELCRQMEAHKGALTMGDVLRLQELTTNQIAGLNESLGKSSDRLHLLGLQEILAAIAACPINKDAPLPQGKVIGRDVTPAQVAIMPDLNDLRQRQLLANFLNVYDRIKIKPQDVVSGDFGFIIIPSMRPKSANNTGAAGADVMLYLGKGSMGVGYQLALPLALPDDRRDKTAIELLL